MYDMVLLHPQYIATAFYVVHYKTIVICHTDTRTHSHTQEHYQTRQYAGGPRLDELTQIQTHTLIFCHCCERCPPADVESLPSKHCTCTETQSYFFLVA